MKVFSIKLGRSTMMMLALSLSFLLLWTPQSAAAATKTWISTSSTDWNTPGNWSPNTVPTATDDVTIFNDSSIVAPSISSNVGTIASLTIPKTINITGGGSLTVNGDVIINGTLNNQGTLTVKGNFTNNATYTQQTSGTVVMNGSAAQTIGGNVETSFYNLTINNAAGVSLATNATVKGALTLTSGNLVLGAKTLTMGTSATATGSSASFINASGDGVVRKEFSATGSFTYPIGTPGEYSPIMVNIAAGSFAGGNEYVDARVRETHESHVNTSGTSYIERHWILSDSTISGLSANLTMTYVALDVNGTEGDLLAGFYDSATMQWIVGTLLAPQGDVSISGLTALNGSATAGSTGALAVQLASFSANLTGNDVLVEWRTLYELNNAGFNLYRSTSADSLGSKINGEMIQSQAPGSGQEGEYQYQDSNIESGVTYFYTLEDVDVNGVTTRYGPVSVDTSNVTTAVTLEEIGTSSTSQSALYLLLGSVLFAGAAFILRRRSA